eukprot:SAG11_NODE_8659_length_990_cov_1.236813_2_plen_245_part_00
MSHGRVTRQHLRMKLQQLTQPVVTMTKAVQTESLGSATRSVPWFSIVFIVDASGSWRRNSVLRKWRGMTSCFLPVHEHCRQSRCCGRLWCAVQTRPIRVLMLSAGNMGAAMVELVTVMKRTRGRVVKFSILVLELTAEGMDNALVAFAYASMGVVEIIVRMLTHARCQCTSRAIIMVVARTELAYATKATQALTAKIYRVALHAPIATQDAATHVAVAAHTNVAMAHAAAPIHAAAARLTGGVM